jgi:hypothetical protein
MIFLKFFNYLNLFNLVIIALMSRLIALLVFGVKVFPDSKNYIEAGDNLLQNGLIEAHHIMPLFPLITAFLNTNLNIILFNISLSLINVVLIYKISSLIFKNKNISVIAAFIWSIYPFSIFYSISALTETLFVSLVLGTFYFMYQKNTNIAFFLAVLSILLKPTLELFFPFFIIFFSHFIYKNNFKNTSILLIKYLLIYLLVMSFWWIHQYNKYGELVRLNLGDGIVWYSGNNALNTSGGGVHDPLKGKDMEMRQFYEAYSNPIDLNDALKVSAFNYIKSNPTHFFKMTTVKFLRFWRLWPYSSYFNSPFYVFISLTSYGVILFLSIFALRFFNSKQVRLMLPIFFLFFYLTAIHMILIASIRYRFPLEPFLTIFAAFSLFKILGKNLINESK